jgi:hypothetical protein
MASIGVHRCPAIHDRGEGSSTMTEPDPIFDNFVRAFCDLTDQQRERFGREYASLLIDLIGDYPFDDEPTFGTVVPRRAR